MPFNFPTFTFDLGRSGAPEMTITLKDPKIMKWGDVKAIQAAILNNDFEMLEKTYAGLIVDWTVQYEDGNPAPLPKDKPDVFDDLPQCVMEELSHALQERAKPPKN